MTHDIENPSGCPASSFHTSRRGLLKGVGAAAGGSLALALCPAARASEPPNTQVADAPQAHAEARARQPFYGEHQSGIVTPRPESGLVASFDIIAQTPDDLEAFLRRLSERIAFLTGGGRPPQLDHKLPPADSGILGPLIEPDNLTITASLGAALFDNRPWLAPLKPKHLIAMQQFPNDALDADCCHGELSLQFCANSQNTNIHALRDILKMLPEFLVLKWKQEGNVPVIPPKADGSHESARNFLGFRDGSANPNSTDGDLMQRVVWVGPQNGEPQWAMGGSYQVIRIIRNFVERWDRTPLQEQEAIFGRRKMSGAPMGGTTEMDEPVYADDPDGERTPLDAHIRRANPRTQATSENLILRRPFNYSNGVAKSGQLDQGLLFIVYQADLQKGFITVQNRLNGEPLEEYIKPVGGGYFYTLPGVRNEKDYLGRSLVEAVRAA